MTVPFDPALLAETTTVAIGLRGILEGAPERLGAELRRKAAAMVREIRTAMMGFLGRTDFQRAAALPPFNYDTISKLVSSSGTPEQGEALLQAVRNPELGRAVTAVATRAIHYLAGLNHPRTRVTLTGAEKLPPPGQDQARFRRAWNVACDPMIALRDLSEGSLTGDMARALSEVYPAIYGAVKLAIREGIVAMKARRKTWTLSSAKERQLNVLMLAPHFDVDLARLVQQSYAAAPPSGQPGQAGAPKAKPSKMKVDSDATATPGQRQG